MSSDLVWQILKKGNAFLVKRDGVTLSREPCNLRNVHSFKYSGLANSKAIGVEAEDGAVAVVAKKKSWNKPASSLSKNKLGKSVRRGARGIAGLVESRYRPDLKQAALARLTRLNQAAKRKAAGISAPTRRTRKPGSKRA